MLSLPTPKAIVIRESKIVHKSLTINPLARFVTEEAVCLMFNLKPESIYVIECWRYMVYVHAKGVSKFVSYADFPPIVGVRPPTQAERAKWRRRWRKQLNPEYRKQAPKWWTEFLLRNFGKPQENLHLLCWRDLVESIKFAFNEESLQKLRKELLYISA
ncbi:hypothetical protein [Fischerella thermalis]|jgi:hypothetical protein|uniref:Uncharacterized protein n=1 Tax=Fischerella thermalis JSC-11 TaxID=741277 RepID=G6FVV3_9CYAN|nr:hypothetical protein [Fischerella thermalis]PLZ79962.1 hypothetical protein CBP16_14730 [Fischerella thermalis WC217]RDH49951.1 hypothetical protein CBF18_13810 [Mastigocladus laminosus WC112]EHC11592.1 hypothetical protein FJSC11DRAFT_3044 [Fischerella thermalis JSC-11]PLZ04834.1 hypothetical protein CBP17_21685 [Fischerella thermalis WC114]PLZ12223.1 hypothetical protein CBP18_06665 [Fischerella thermalis WC119]